MTETDYLTTPKSFVFPSLLTRSTKPTQSSVSLLSRFVLAVSEINDVFLFNCGAPGCCDLITKCIEGRHPGRNRAVLGNKFSQNCAKQAVCYSAGAFSRNVMEQMLDESENDELDLQLSSLLSIILDVIAI